jgi:hypothetical protein
VSFRRKPLSVTVDWRRKALAPWSSRCANVDGQLASPAEAEGPLVIHNLILSLVCSSLQVVAREGEMAQHMLSASGGIFVPRGSKPQATLVRGRSLAGIGSKQFLLACNASSSPAPPQEGADCNEEECAPEKEVPRVYSHRSLATRLLMHN